MSSSFEKSFDVVDREVLRNLLKENSIDWYYFHEKYKLSPGQLSRSIKKLEAWNFLIIEDGLIRATDEGRIAILSERNKIFRRNSEDNYDKIQQERLGNKININQFYLPRKKK